MNYTLKQLRYFAVAADLGSVTKASQHLSISQPSLSSAIVELEGALNTQLFVRHHAKGLSLTSAGTQILDEAKRLLVQAERFNQISGELVNGLGGKVDVGCLLTLAPLVMPALLKSLKQDYGALTVGCKELDIEKIIGGLRNGEFEFGITYNLNIEADIVFRGVRDFPPYALLPQGHPLQRKARLKLKMLAGEPMILLDLPHTRDYFQMIFDSAQVKPNIVYRTASPQMVRSMVASGMGYSILNARLIGGHSSGADQYGIVELAEKLPPLRMGLVHLKKHEFTRAAQIVMEEFQRQNDALKREPRFRRAV